MKQKELSDKEKIVKLEAQVAALKVAFKKEHAAKLSAEKDIDRLISFSQSLTENLDIAKIMLWASKSEKLTDSDLKKLRKDLARTIMNPDKGKDIDIAEASRPEEMDQQSDPPIIEADSGK